MIKNNEYLDWLYVMGLKNTIELLDEQRAEFYTTTNTHLDLTGYILATFTEKNL